MEKKTTKKAKGPGRGHGKSTGNKPDHRSTQAELALRIDTIYGMLCDGKSRANIILTSTEMWGITERQTDNYIAEARKRLEEDCRMSREAFMAEALAGYRSIREQAERRGQLMCSKQCLDSMVSLVGLTK
mgnify:CR=1 FL=1